MTSPAVSDHRLLRPGELETDLRKLADALYARPPATDNPLAALVANRVDIESARSFWARQWHVEQAYNQYALPRLMEACPDVDARVQVFDVIGGEWGRGDPSRANPALFRQFLLGLGVAAEAVPWEYDARRDEIARHIQRWEAGTWLELLVGELLGVKTVAPKVYGAIAGALLAAPYGLSEAEVAFFRAHEEADVRDCDIVFELVARYAVTAELQAQARDALRAFATGSRYADYCCQLGAAPHAFEAQPGGIPLRLRDPVPPALRTPEKRSKSSIQP
ncbi:MAG TPA: iron-containing redox enzyme family protein [Kofleriaceae bacterium]